jgi:hypothetical protein
MLKQRFGSVEKSQGNAGNENRAEESGEDESDEIEPAILIGEAVAKNAPAEPGHDANLFRETATGC